MKEAVVMVVGGGGREDIIAMLLARSPHVGKVYVIPGNGGTQRFGGVRVPILATDIPKIIEAAKERKVKLVVVGPEAPLVAGLVDALEKEGIPAFGPSAYCAQLEGDKIFTKIRCREWDMPTAPFDYAGIHEGAEQAIKNLHYRVVKRRGLAAGKGVTVAESDEEAMKVAREIIGSGEVALFEKRLFGDEASAMYLCDGKTSLPFLFARDHKRALNGNKGGMTGGTGAYSPVPNMGDEFATRIKSEIIIPTLVGVRREGSPYKGVLYAGLMLTATGPKLLEYNVRFGDPELQAILRLLENDIYEIIEACVSGRLSEIELKWRPGFAVCVVLMAGGYPAAYKKGDPIYGLEEASLVPGVEIFHAGTNFADGRYYTDGGRVLNVTATGNTLEEARARAYEAAKYIHFDNMHFRTDIGLIAA